MSTCNKQEKRLGYSFIGIMKNKKKRIEELTLDFLKSRLDINTKFKGLYVFDTDSQEMDTSFMSPYRADHNSIHLITDGEVNVKINLLEYTLRKNDLVLFTTNTIRHFGKVTPDCKATNLLFSNDYLLNSAIPSKTAEAYDYLTGIISPVSRLSEDQVDLFKAQLSVLALKMKDTRANRFYAEDILRHLFSALIFEVGALYQSEVQPYVVPGSRKEYVVHQFLKLVMKKFKVERSVQAYADMLNITPKYLTTATRGLTGKTAGELIDEMLIVEAKVLLNESGLPIAHIAESLNFSDQFVFSKFFKKHCGQNPSSYRRTA
ncbi:helix-turn-helix domain-containing protein [Pedobacter sp. KBS0701]|uniref:AraC family transcriptional regulator n=1 Tax=Pedobacter sp. KBS0701 TaxID=2578106 RepID=UPI00110EE07A|nr:AraC family transcriptional regulator [Pedobacter sp. KBS0701]QDW24134.1 helix-turn-helix domain-containing protein [Pedobacter sp. KBS0701]